MSNDLTTAEMSNTTSTEDHKMMASFRIDRELWARFGKLAKNERLTATDILTDYIQRCTDNDKSQYAVRMDTYDSDELNNLVIMMVDTAIAASLPLSVQVSVESVLAPIIDRVQEIERSTQSQLQAMRHEIEKVLSERVKSSSIENMVKSPGTGRESNVNPDCKPMTKRIRRWLKSLKDKKFKGIVQVGISEQWSNQEIVTKLFEAGYGKDNNTNPYPADLASAMKTALSIEAGDPTSI